VNEIESRTCQANEMTLVSATQVLLDLSTVFAWVLVLSLARVRRLDFGV
jgi:hypothetical protein